MKKMNVLHFIRKKSQLKASFIKNQITSHIEFSPSVVYRFDKYKGNEGGFAKLDYKELTEINLSKENGSKDKIYFKIFKKITSKQRETITRFITDNNINILHFHYGTDAGIYLPMLKKVNIPKVVSFYGYECSGFPKRFFGLGKSYLRNRTFKLADMIFAMSEDMRKDLLEIGCPDDKIRVHYYGTDTGKFVMEHDYIQKQKVNFLIISGLTPQKGHIFLLKALHKAFQENQNIQLTIVGEGPVKDVICQTIEELSMGKYVDIKPFVIYASEEHMNYFSNADVFIHPSLTDVNGDKEGIPGALVEAMATGLPVISTNHAGIPYIIENEKNGLLADEWDIDGLAKSILRLAADVDLRKKIGKAGQDFATHHLELHEKEKELEEIYKSLIDKKTENQR